MKRIFPTALDLVVLVGIFFLLQVVVVMGFAAFGMDVMGLVRLMTSEGEPTIEQQQWLGRVNALVYGVSMAAMLLCTLWYRHVRHGRGRIVSLSSRGFNPTLLLWGFVMTVAATVVIGPVVEALPAPTTNAYGRGAWALLMLVAMAPLFEEFLCRGIILESARTRYGAVAAVFISSLFFGILHGYPAAVVNAFVLGLVFGFVYIQSRSLLSVVILHALHNGIGYLLMMLGLYDTSLRTLIPNAHLYWIVYLSSAVVLIASGGVIYKKLKFVTSHHEKSTSTPIHPPTPPADGLQ